MHTTPLPWYVKLGIAIALGFVSLASVGIDLVNSYLYGLMTAPAMGVLAALIALSIPLLAFCIEMGAPKSLRILQIACMAAIMYCAWQYYVVSAKQNNVVATVAHEVYTSAAEEKKLALETMRRIKEHGDIEDLGKIASNADANLTEAVANVAKYCKSRRVTDDCTTAKQSKTLAENAATLAHTKLSDSKSWHAASVTLAKMNVTQTKGDAVEKEVDTYAIVGALIFVQIFASLMGLATRHGQEALAARPRKAKKLKAPANIDPSNGGARLIGPNIINFALAEWRNARTSKATGEIRGGDAKKNFERYTGTKITAEAFREALIALLGAEAIQANRSGYLISGIRLNELASTNKAKKSATA